MKKVKDLVAELLELDGELPIFIRIPAEDGHWGAKVPPEVYGYADEVYIFE